MYVEIQIFIPSLVGMDTQGESKLSTLACSNSGANATIGVIGD